MVFCQLEGGDIKHHVPHHLSINVSDLNGVICVTQILFCHQVNDPSISGLKGNMFKAQDSKKNNWKKEKDFQCTSLSKINITLCMCALYWVISYVRISQGQGFYGLLSIDPINPSRAWKILWQNNIQIYASKFFLYIYMHHIFVYALTSDSFDAFYFQ